MERIMEKKLGPTEFQAEVQRLHAAGQLPSLEDVLAAVAEAREEYAPQILEARNQGEDENASTTE
jgi:hypothetical protein